MLAPGASAVKILCSLLLLTSVASCADDASPDSTGEDLPLGDLPADMGKADGDWGAALTCKDVPNLPPLVSPKITVSLNGLTLHLTDAVTGFDKVFPIGPGRIETDPTSGEFGESLSYHPIATSGRHDFAITPSSIQPCKTWWTDPETGAQSPVFAGLPFMSWSGNYAIHGPIDNFTAPNGGNLRRGFVSHGCIRMEAADVLEVYARIKGVSKTPVHVQREPELTPERTKVDLAAKWIGSQCTANTDCNFAGGFCATNKLTQRGFCSARCTSGCADRAGYPQTFCVADPSTGANNALPKGMCVPKAVDQNFDCRPYDHFQPVTLARLNQPLVKANVCMPASPGWVGDHCTAGTDCTSGTTCVGATVGHPGVCTMACTQFCADQPGYADTFCAAMPSLAAGGSCLRQCTPSSNASECPTDMACAPAPRFGQPTAVKSVCTPVH